jgi:hypothetical protein
MKNLEEKKLLLKMMRAFGQDDKELAESIRREEELTEKLFGGKKVEPAPLVEIIEEKKPEPVVLKEAEPLPPPAPAFTPPTTNTVIDVVNVLKTANANTNIYRDKELEGMRRTIAEMMQKISTMSWGGGGTGIVRLFDADDFDRNSIINDKQFVTFRNGWFQMDYINPNEIVANTVLVTSNSYQITNDDYYIGVNVASTVTITLPPSADVYTGREFYVKDESGNAGAPARFIDIYPSGSDKIDNHNYVRLQVDNGGLKFIYRDGWRVI